MNMKLTNPNIGDWCRMWRAMEKLGYDTTKDIHPQFAEKHKVREKKKPPKNIRRYNPSDCVEYWKSYYEGTH